MTSLLHELLRGPVCTTGDEERRRSSGGPGPHFRHYNLDERVVHAHSSHDAVLHHVPVLRANGHLLLAVLLLYVVSGLLLCG